MYSNSRSSVVASAVFVACLTALSVLPVVGSPADQKDPRETYSTDGWKLAWSEEFNGKVVPAAKFPMEMKIDYVRYYTKGE